MSRGDDASRHTPLLGAWFLHGLLAVILGMAMIAIVGAAVLAFVRVPIGGLASMILPAWAGALGAPVHVDETIRQGSLVLQGGMTCRLPFPLLVLVASLPFLLAGYAMAGRARGPGMGACLCLGAAVALPAALVGALLAWMLPPGQAFLALAEGSSADFRASVAPLHAAGAILACGLAMGALGGAWRGRASVGAGDEVGRGVAAALVAVLLAAVLASAAAGVAAVPLWKDVALRRAGEAMPGQQGLWMAAAATVPFGLMAQAPVVLSRVPVRGEVVAVSSEVEGGSFQGRVALDAATGLGGDLPERVPLPLWLAWTGLLSLLATGVGGCLAPRGRRGVLVFAGTLALLWLLVGAYGSSWLDLRLEVKATGAPSLLHVWGWWHAGSWGLLLSAAVQALAGGLVAVARSRGGLRAP